MTQRPRERQGLSILIVEDNTDLRRVLTDILQFEGYVILGASNGEEALKVLAASNVVPQLIMTDVLMDGMDGCDFLSAIRADKRWCDVPVMFLSGQKNVDSTCGPGGLKPDAFVEKPFTIAELLKAIKSLLTD